MRCRYCGERAGWWRRNCMLCRKLLQAYADHRGLHMGDIMEAFLATGASRSHVEAFLDADPDGTGSMRDQIAADMTNELMGALGQRRRQSPGEVRRIRERGNWVGYGQRPRE